MRAINSCRKCGGTPTLDTYRLCEDAEGCRVRCACGARGDEIEDAYVDEGMKLDAIRAWNNEN